MQALAKDFREESEALHALVAPLDDEALNRITAFKGWTIAMSMAPLASDSSAGVSSTTSSVPKRSATFRAASSAPACAGS